MTSVLPVPPWASQRIRLEVFVEFGWDGEGARTCRIRAKREVEV